MAEIRCSGSIDTDVTGAPLCRDELGSLIEWQSVPEFEIDFSQIVEPFSVGFLLIASFWAIGHGVGLVIDLVRR